MTIVETRAPYGVNEGGTSSSSPIAQFRFDGTVMKWSLYWPDQSSRCHRYQHLAASDFDRVLTELETNSRGYFGL